MKRTALRLGTLSLVLALAAPGLAQAQEARKGLLRNILVVFAPPNADQQRNIAQTVGLSEEQQAKMKEVNERYRSDAAALRERYQSAYNDVVQLMGQTNPNKTTVNQKLKAFHRVHAEVLDREVQYWTDFKSILTPEQNRKFWNMFEQNRARGGGEGD